MTVALVPARVLFVPRVVVVVPLVVGVNGCGGRGGGRGCGAVAEIGDGFDDGVAARLRRVVFDPQAFGGVVDRDAEHARHARHDLLDVGDVRALRHALERQGFVAKTVGDGRALIARQTPQFVQRHQVGIVVQTQNRRARLALRQVNRAHAALVFQPRFEARHAAVAPVLHTGQNDRHVQLQRRFSGRQSMFVLRHWNGDLIPALSRGIRFRRFPT